MIDLYFAPTPNGWKIAIMLEECALEYQTTLMRLHAGDQFRPEFLGISPAGQMPAIVDHDTPGEPAAVFESAAILLYLADKTGRFAPPAGALDESAARRELVQWLFWQAGNQGPAGGQLSHFVNYAPPDEAYGRKRYANEYRRNLTVLENRLQGRDYILDEYSIADMACFPWAFIAGPLGVDLSVYPAVQAWRGRIKTRPAVHRAIDLHKDKQNRGRHTAQNNDLLFNQDGSQLKQPPS